MKRKNAPIATAVPLTYDRVTNASAPYTVCLTTYHAMRASVDAPLNSPHMVPNAHTRRSSASRRDTTVVFSAFMNVPVHDKQAKAR